MKGRKFSLLLLVLTLMVSLFAGCSGGGDTAENKDTAKGMTTDTPTASDNATKEGFPIVKDKITIKGFGSKLYDFADWNTLKLWQEYEKMTNIHIDWTVASQSNLKEKRNIVLGGGDLPDMFFAAAIPRADLIKYGEEGAFLKLNDYIDQYAPNFKAIMEKYPLVRKAITMPDGSIYGMPTIYDPEFKSLFYGTPWMKKEWLDNLSLQEPTTLDDFYNVLKAIKEKDPNKNGKADEIGWGSGYGADGLINFLKGSFGLGTHGSTHPYVDTDPNGGSLRFIPTDTRYKEMLEYAHKLYKDGLLDSELFTLNGKDTEFTSKASTGVYGFLDSVDPTAVFNQEGYIGTPVLEGPHGDRINTMLGSPVGGLGMFVLTANNKNPAEMVRWMDYFYSDEGAKMFFLGWKDVTYKEMPNGEFEYTDEITKNPKGLTLDQAISQYLMWPGGYYPGIVKQKFFKGAEGRPTSVDNAKKAEPFTIKIDDVWPSFNYTAEETEELTTIANDITTYVGEMRDKFIIGDESFDKWDEYVSTIQKMNLDRYMEIYKQAYDRYMSDK